MMHRLKLLCDRLAYENYVPPADQSGQPQNQSPSSNQKQVTMMNDPSGGKRPVTLMDLFPINQGRG